MRVNVDGCVLGDPRFKRLGRALAIPWTDALGRCLLLWFVAYERRTPLMGATDVDVIAERDGFADAMLEVGLAWPSDGQIHLAGVRDRIQFLLAQQERGRAGGREAARKRAHDIVANATANAQASAKRTLKRPSGLPPDPDPSPALALDPDHSQDPERESAHAREAAASGSSATPTKRKSKPKGCTEQELADAALVLRKLSERSGRTYGGSQVHTMLVVSRLRAGYTQWDLRRVIGYCAIELDWENKPDMQPYLRPETLFGPKSMERYVHAARSWMPSGEADEELQPQRNQPMNVLPFPLPTASPAGPAYEEPPWMTSQSPK